MARNNSIGFKMPSANTTLEFYKAVTMAEVNGEKLQSNADIDLYSDNSGLKFSNDPIHVQLLVETALRDSRDFKILSQEVVEEIKRECKALTNQIDQIRQTLNMKCKYHETSLSVARLSRTKSPENTTSENPRGGHNTLDDEDDQDLAGIQRECEELASKIFQLERQLLISQNRLQRHTAGILQFKLNEIHDSGETYGSSENMYTFKPRNEKPEIINEDFLFDERSLYSELEILSRNDEEMGAALTAQIDKICTTEKKLVDLNNRLRETICIMDPKYESSPSPPPISRCNDDSLNMLETHLEFMEKSIAIVEQEQGIVKNQHDLIISQVDELLEQKSILQKQIKQQRELSSNPDGRSSSELHQKTKELAEMSALQVETDNEVYSLREQVDIFKIKLDEVTKAEKLHDATIKEKDIVLAQKERKIDEIQMDMARLRTEVTLAKAELEAAYGSRAERAAQVAANPAIQRELERLLSENSSLTSEIAAIKSQTVELESVNNDEIVNELKKELAELVGEYELMTKASFEWEKERDQLDKTIDNLRDAKDQIEAQLYEEKIRWMGMQDFGTEALSPDSRTTSTTILKNEFKKMTRDIREEHMKLLRAERAERRRLEDEVRNLRKSRSS